MTTISEPETIIYQLSVVFVNDDTGRLDRISIAYSKSIDMLKQKAIDTNKNIYDKQWIQEEDFIELKIGDDYYKDSYIIKQITLI